jgi:hypothetical protein
MNFGTRLHDVGEKHIEELVTELYQLKSFGGNLKSMSKIISSVHKVIHSERPHRVKHQEIS